MNNKPKGFVQAVYSRLHVVLVVMAAGLAAAWWIGGQLTPIYKSQARFFMPAEFDGFSLRSEQPNFPTGPKLPSSNTEQQDSLLGLMRSAAFRITIANDLQGLQNTDHLNSEALRKNVDVDVDKFNMTVVTAYDQHPQIAADIAGRYVTELQRMLRQKTEAEVGAKLELLLSRVETNESLLAAKEEQRLTFIEKNKSLGDPKESDAISIRFAAFRLQQASLQAEQIRNSGQLEKIKAEFAARPEFIESSWVEENNPRINQLKSEFASAEIELQTVLTKVQSSHVDAIAAQTKLDLVRNNLAAEEEKREKSRTFQLDSLREAYGKQITTLELDEMRIAAELTSCQQQLALTQAEWNGLASFQSQLTVIDRDLGQLRKDLGELRDRHAEFELFQARFRSTSNNPHNYLEVTEFATAASTPWFPNQNLNLGIALALSLLLGIILAVLSTRISEWRERAPW